MPLTEGQIAPAVEGGPESGRDFNAEASARLLSIFDNAVQQRPLAGPERTPTTLGGVLRGATDPGAVIRSGLGQAATGLTYLGSKVGLASNEDVARQARGAATQSQIEDLRLGQGAGAGAGLTSMVAPTLLPVGPLAQAGMFAGQMGLQEGAQAVTANATPGQELAAVGLGSAAGLVAPAAGSVLSAGASRVGRALLPAAAKDATGVILSPALRAAVSPVEGAVGGFGTNLALSGGGSLAQATYDPTGAATRFGESWSDPILPILGALTHGAGGLADYRAGRSAPIAGDPAGRPIEPPRTPSPQSPLAGGKTIEELNQGVLPGAVEASIGAGQFEQRAPLIEGARPQPFADPRLAVEPQAPTGVPLAQAQERAGGFAALPERMVPAQERAAAEQQLAQSEYETRAAQEVQAQAQAREAERIGAEAQAEFPPKAPKEPVDRRVNAIRSVLDKAGEDRNRRIELANRAAKRLYPDDAQAQLSFINDVNASAEKPPLPQEPPPPATTNPPVQQTAPAALERANAPTNEGINRAQAVRGHPGPPDFGREVRPGSEVRGRSDLQHPSQGESSDRQISQSRGQGPSAIQGQEAREQTVQAPQGAPGPGGSREGRRNRLSVQGQESLGQADRQAGGDLGAGSRSVPNEPEAGQRGRAGSSVGNAGIGNGGRGRPSNVETPPEALSNQNIHPGDVRTGAATRADGSVAIDSSIPMKFWKYLRVHELTERYWLDQGVPFEEAHQRATEAEHRAVKADGKDPAQYENELKPHLDRVWEKPADSFSDLDQRQLTGYKLRESVPADTRLEEARVRQAAEDTRRSMESRRGRLADAERLTTEADSAVSLARTPAERATAEAKQAKAHEAYVATAGEQKQEAAERVRTAKANLNLREQQLAAANDEGSKAAVHEARVELEEAKADLKESSAELESAKAATAEAKAKASRLRVSEVAVARKAREEAKARQEAARAEAKAARERALAARKAEVEKTQKRNAEIAAIKLRQEQEKARGAEAVTGAKEEKTQKSALDAEHARLKTAVGEMKAKLAAGEASTKEAAQATETAKEAARVANRRVNVAQERLKQAAGEGDPEALHEARVALEEAKAEKDAAKADLAEVAKGTAGAKKSAAQEKVEPLKEQDRLNAEAAADEMKRQLDGLGAKGVEVEKSEDGVSVKVENGVAIETKSGIIPVDPAAWFDSVSGREITVKGKSLGTGVEAIKRQFQKLGMEVPEWLDAPDAAQRWAEFTKLDPKTAKKIYNALDATPTAMVLNIDGQRLGLSKQVLLRVQRALAGQASKMASSLREELHHIAWRMLFTAEERATIAKELEAKYPELKGADPASRPIMEKAFLDFDAYRQRKATEPVKPEVGAIGRFIKNAMARLRSWLGFADKVPHADAKTAEQVWEAYRTGEVWQREAKPMEEEPTRAEESAMATRKGGRKSLVQRLQDKAAEKTRGPVQHAADRQRRAAEIAADPKQAEEVWNNVPDKNDESFEAAAKQTYMLNAIADKVRQFYGNLSNRNLTDLRRLTVLRARSGSSVGREMQARKIDTTTPEGRKVLLLNGAVEMDPRTLAKYEAAEKLSGAAKESRIKALDDAWLKKQERIKADLKRMGLDITDPDLGESFDAYSIQDGLEKVSIARGPDGLNLGKLYAWYAVGNLLGLKTIMANNVGMGSTLGLSGAKALSNAFTRYLAPENKGAIHPASQLKGVTAGLLAAADGLKIGLLSTYMGKPMAGKKGEVRDLSIDAERQNSPTLALFSWLNPQARLAADAVARILATPTLEAVRLSDNMMWHITSEGAKATYRAENARRGGDLSEADIAEMASVYADWFTLRAHNPPPGAPKPGGPDLMRAANMLRSPTALSDLYKARFPEAPSWTHRVSEAAINPGFTIMPFFNAILRLTGQGLSISPAGAPVHLGMALGRSLNLKGLEPKAREEQVAKALNNLNTGLVGVALGGMILALGSNVTGAAPTMGQTPAETDIKGSLNPYRSVGGLDISRIDPAAMPTFLWKAVIDNAQKYAKDGNFGSAINSTMDQAFNAVVDRNFLSGLANLIKPKVDQETGEQLTFMQKLLINMGAMSMPGRNYSSSIRSLTETTETRYGGSVMEQAYGTQRRKFSAVGENEQTREPGYIPAIQGLIFPAHGQPSAENRPLLQRLVDTNDEVAAKGGKKWYPAPPTRNLQFSELPKPVRMSADDYDEYVQNVGLAWKKIMQENKQTLDEEKDPAIRLKIMSKMHEAATEEAKAPFMYKYAKLNKLTD